MRISYVRIENFRNFQACEVELGNNAVLIGENRTGKSNFLYALRLVLDPSLSDQERYLVEHDFWDGDRPFAGREIKVVVRFADFADGDNPEELALFWLSSCLISQEPTVAQLTYRYYNAQKPTNPEDATFDDYEFEIFAGENSAQKFDDIGAMRRSMPLHLIKALRDISGDSQSWRRNPLRRLLELSELTSDTLEPYAQKIQAISEEISKIEPIANLEKDIQHRFIEMVGRICASVPSLSLDAISTTELIKSLTLFMDGDKRRDINRVSLGLQNALYLALLSLLLDKQQIKHTRQQQRFLPIVALEEPEAHLHPHLQRLIFHDFLKRARARQQPVIISTHSPHIVSVTAIDDLVIFRDLCERGSEIKSAMSFMEKLPVRERKDLERFIDITKAEMLFAKGVIFVEGDVEALLVIEFAEILGTPLDQRGVSICNVNGVHFSHVVALAHRFGIPFIVLTDGDFNAPVTGVRRAASLLEEIDSALHQRLNSLLAQQDEAVVLAELSQCGIFVNKWTFEVSLLEAGNADILRNVFRELGEEIGVEVRAGIAHIDQYMVEPRDDIVEKLLRSVADARWGKGRFAHRLIKHLRLKADSTADTELRQQIVPDYIRRGIVYLLMKIPQ